MDKLTATWVEEVRRFNDRLHLVSQSMEKNLEEHVQYTMDMLAGIHEPAIGDLGSGSGFLGIPYKIMNPSAHVSLIERSEKKCLFLRHVTDRLGLGDIDVVEADPLKKPVGPFPALMSRSFSPKESLVQAVLRTITLLGKFYYVQTGDPGQPVLPHWVLQDRISKDYKDYRLNLDVYLITSR